MSERTVHVPSQAATWTKQRDWVQLQDLCIGIFDCPHSTPTLSEHGPFLVRSQDIRSGVFLKEEAAHVSEGTYRDRIVRAEPKFGDILYSREGTYFGIAAEMPSNIRACLGQRMVLIRPDPTKVNSRFLRYWLNSPILSQHIHGFRDGSVAERLNLPIIRSLPVPVFPRPQQEQIAETLGSLDDKIDANRAFNRTLEVTARAIFQAWFIDCEPVKAKTNRATTFPDMPQSIFDQLPHDVVDTDTGQIPYGWRVGTLAELSQLNPESWSGKHFPDQLEYVDLSSTKWGAIQRTERYDWASAPSRARRIVRPGDTIVGTVRPANGAYALIDQEGLTVSTGFAVIRPNKPYLREQIYLAATSNENIVRLGHLADGAAYPAVRPEVVSQTTATIAPTSFVQAFSAITSPLLDLIGQNFHENTTLATIREALLPRLLSGRVKLRAVDGADDDL